MEAGDFKKMYKCIHEDMCQTPLFDTSGYVCLCAYIHRAYGNVGIVCV